MVEPIDEAATRKQMIFENMSPRQQKRIAKIGYHKWNPFEEPKDPIDIRKDVTKRTTQQLVREFLQQRPQENYSNAYSRGVLEMALGIINGDDRFLGMLDFAKWYQQEVEKAVAKPDSE